MRQPAIDEIPLARPRSLASLLQNPSNSRYVLRVACIVSLVLGSVACTMEWDRYVDLLTRADSALGAKQDRLEQDFRLGTYAHFDYDEGTGTIVFSDSGVAKVLADIQFVGDVSRRDSVWRWAWDLPYVLPDFSQDAH